MTKNYLLITGASSGIGRECAIKLSEEYNLVLCARNIKELEKTKILCQNSDNHLLFPYDLSDIDFLEEKLANFIRENNIIIDKFLHSAGTMGMMSLKLVTPEFMMNCLKINLISAEFITKTLAGKKYNQKALNNVVFISSNISTRGAKAFSVYSASKSGLDGMMRSLALELAPQVRVNSVLPGGGKHKNDRSANGFRGKTKGNRIKIPVRNRTERIYSRCG